MKSSLKRGGISAGLLVFAIFTVGLSIAGAESDIVAVSSTRSSDYNRSKSSEGKFVPESFAFAEGGLWAENASDASLDKIKFIKVANTILPALNLQNYVTSTNPQTTQLLIMVYWGKTTIPVSTKDSVAFQNLSHASDIVAQAKSKSPILPQSKQAGDRRELQRALEDLGDTAQIATLENTVRDQQNAKNASLLGYDKWWNATVGIEFGPMSYRRNDLISELEDRRYFVILMAYDFQLLWKQRKHKLLWETRFSIRDRGHEFDKNLQAMALKASQYFGQNTNGLVHKDLPEGHIEEGELQVIDHPK